MANTFSLISAITLGGATASVSFTGIPSTFTDLCLKWSARGSVSGNSNLNLRLKLNNSAVTEYSAIQLYAFSAAASSIDTGFAYVTIDSGAPSAGDTASTFGYGELYLPSYTVSTNKPFGSVFTAESNTSSVIRGFRAMLWRNTSAVTSLDLTTNSGDFETNSSFYLYGIKNS